MLKSHWLRAIFNYNLRTRFFQACSFHRMLMNHENFRFTQIADKNNDVIFLKSPKSNVFGPFLTIFGHLA